MHLYSWKIILYFADLGIIFSQHLEDNPLLLASTVANVNSAVTVTPVSILSFLAGYFWNNFVFVFWSFTTICLGVRFFYIILLELFGLPESENSSIISLIVPFPHFLSYVLLDLPFLITGAILPWYPCLLTYMLYFFKCLCFSILHSKWLPIY